MDIYKYLAKKYELYTNKEFRECNLSKNTEKILCDIGLPKNPLNFIQFDISEIKKINLSDEYIIIGDDFGTKVCIGPKEQIVSVDLEGEYPIRFINQNLETFLKCIVTYTLYENELSNINDDYSVKKILKKVSSEFKAVDILALSEEESWWSIILEQIEVALL